MKDEEYFSLARLSASGVKKLLKTPAHFLQEVEQTPAMALGSLVHCLCLEPKKFDSAYVIGESDKRTKAGKEFFDLAEKNGKIPVKESDYEKACLIREAVMKHRIIGDSTFGKYLESCETEKAVLWEQEFSCGIVSCKSKIDAVNHAAKIIVDLKTCTDASPEAFSMAIYGDLGYFIQAVFYRMNPRFSGFKFAFLAVEKEPPYATGMYFVDDACRNHALELIEKAAERFLSIEKAGKKASSQYNEAGVLEIPRWFGR